MIQNFKQDFKELIDLVHSNKPFALSRFADGEIAIMQGRQKNGADKWISPDYLTSLGSDLLECISLQDDNVYFGISCGCCDTKGRDYLLDSVIITPKKGDPKKKEPIWHSVWASTTFTIPESNL